MEVKKIKPMYTKFVCTADKYVDADAKMAGGIIDASKMKTGLREYQKVIAIGSSCRSIKEGDIVCINPDRYAVKRRDPNALANEFVANATISYNFPMVRLNGVDCLLLDENDVEFIVEEYED